MTEDKDEQALNDYLSGSSDISQAYRDSAQKQPSADLDAAILAAARKSVKSKPRLASSPFSSHWSVPLSLAAVLVVSVTLVITVQKQHPDAYVQAPEQDISSEITGESFAQEKNTAIPVTEKVVVTAQRRSEPADQDARAVAQDSVAKRSAPAKPASFDLLAEQGFADYRQDEEAEQDLLAAAPPPQEMAESESLLNEQSPQFEFNRLLEANDDSADQEQALKSDSLDSFDVQRNQAGKEAELKRELAAVKKQHELKRKDEARKRLEEAKKRQEIEQLKMKQAQQRVYQSVEDKSQTAVAAGMSSAQELTTDLLQSLIGPWQGKAVVTPVGPTDYDIHFKDIGDQCVSGTSDNGVSRHKWTFCKLAESTTLEFISDFRGNTQPILFQLVKQERKTYWFKADTHTFMDVILQAETDTIGIEILHDDKSHVVIELTRL